MTASLSDLRREYNRRGLMEHEADPDPLRQFQVWFDEALQAGVLEPNAMSLATVDDSGQPWSRVVLLKALDQGRFTFFTNYQSRKGLHLARNPRAALNFLWLELERQICITGQVEKLSEEESQAYFASRPRGSQLGALASDQSRPVVTREDLEAKLRQLEKLHRDGPVPKPETWGGYALAPATIEFWQGRPNRLHDRLFYERASDGTWSIQRLSP